MRIEEIAQYQTGKLDQLLSETNARLERVEGPNCNRHHPEMNIVNHPYYWGVLLDRFSSRWDEWLLGTSRE